MEYQLVATAQAGAQTTALPGELPPRLSITGLTKVFGGNRALDDVGLEVIPGEIHGLLGQNGSGKSTLIKVLSGFHAPDAGRIAIDSRSIQLPMPLTRHEALGLAFVHQNLGLFTEGTVLENLIAGDHGRLNPWRINWRREAERARKLFETYHLDIDPNMPLDQLSQVKRAQLAIVRAVDRLREHAIHDGPGLLVLDEPTPFLPMEDVQDLFSMMQHLTADGGSIIFVSHDIDEIMEVTDRATVLRDGKAIGTFDTASKSRAEIVEMIVGRSLKTERSAADTVKVEGKPPIKLSALTGNVVKDCSFDIRQGEILGLTGLIGSGYDEVPYLLSGASKALSGRLTINDIEFTHDQFSPSTSMKHGIALIPADRQKNAISSELSLLENISLPKLAATSGHAFINHGKLRDLCVSLMSKFQVKAEGPTQPASDLSGGNQQKIVLAKWLQLDPAFVLLDEPTQGIDVGARSEIYDILAELCRAGACVLCATSEFEQLEAIAHRVLVFDHGVVTAELSGSAVTKSEIAKACYSRANHAEH